MPDIHELDSPTTTSCPVCGHAAAKVFDHPDAEIFGCPSCSHCFSDPQSVAEEAYGPDYYEETHKNWFENPNTALFEQIRQQALKFGARCSLFDVGCGRGDLLEYLHSKNPEFSLTGVELSALPPSPGIRYLHADIFELDLPEKFDVVTNLAVIEHVADIRDFVARLAGFARPGGLVIAMTLNSDSLVYRIARAGRAAGWPDAFNRLYSHHHLHHYTRASLAKLMRDSELEIVDHHSHNFPLAAVDFPSKGKIRDSIQLAGVAASFALGKLMDMGFLQTIVCRVPDRTPEKS